MMAPSPLHKASFLTGILLLLFSWNALFAQNEISGKRVTLQAKQERLSSVLQEITRQTGLRFSYNPQIVDDEKTITANLVSKPLEEVLQTILPDSIAAKQVGNHLILSLNEKREEKIIAEKPAIETKKTQEIEAVTTAPIEKTETFSEDKTLENNPEPYFSEKKFYSSNGTFKMDCLDSINLKLEEEMKKHFAALLIGAAMTTTQIAAQEAPSTDAKTANNVETASGAPIKNKKPAQFSFVYPLGTDWIYSADNQYGFSVNLIGGFTGSVHGGELATVFNINKYNVKGFQLAGAFNMAGVSSYHEPSSAVQIATAFNFMKNGRAAQIAAGVNIADTGYFQAAAGVNVARLSRAQIAAGANATDNGAFQASVGVNAAGTSAAQLAAGVNVTKKGKFQMAAGVNVAETSKCQIAAGVNVTKKGGFQLGVVNVRDTADGVSLGIINIIAKGGVMEAGVEGGEFIHAAATFRSGTQRLYSIVLVGGNFDDEFLATGFGLGTAFRFTNWLGLNLELMYYGLYNPSTGEKITTQDAFPEEEWRHKGLAQFRPVLNFRIAKHCKLFAGPAFNLLMEDCLNQEILNIRDISVGQPSTRMLNTPKPLFDEYLSGPGLRLRGWIGFTAGIKF